VLSNRWQRANTKNTIKTGSKRAKHEGALAVGTHPREWILGVNKEPPVIGITEQETAHEDMDYKEPERDKAQVLPHLEEAKEPFGLVTKGVSVNRVRRVSEDAWELRYGKSIDGGPADGLVHYKEREAVPGVFIRDHVTV
jgi:hypothetical protein